MTTVTTTETAPNNPSQELSAGIAAEAITTAATATAQAETAVQKANEVSEALETIDKENEEIQRQIDEAEKWKTELQEQILSLAAVSAQQAESMTQIQGALNQVLTLLTPQVSQNAGADGTPEIATATNAPPSDPAQQETLTSEAEQVVEKVARNPLSWI